MSAEIIDFPAPDPFDVRPLPDEPCTVIILPVVRVERFVVERVEKVPDFFHSVVLGFGI